MYDYLKIVLRALSKFSRELLLWPRVKSVFYARVSLKRESDLMNHQPTSVKLIGVHLIVVLIRYYIAILINLDLN